MIKNVLIVGSGTMGTQIALQCAMNNFNVYIYDNNKDSLKKSRTYITSYLDDFKEKGILTNSDIFDIANKIIANDDLTAAGKNADIVSESIPEDVELKRKVFAEVNQVCPGHTIFTTNTSTLLPSSLADSSGRPEKFSALHFHPNIWETKIVDIMPHKKTDKDIVNKLEDFIYRLNLVPITLKKENNNYVFNNLLASVLRAAINLAANDIASYKDIDLSWMAILQTNIGPFGIIDRIGIDTVYTIIKYWAEKKNDPVLMQNFKLLERFVKNNTLGVKTNKGFYSYPDPEYAQW